MAIVSELKKFHMVRFESIIKRCPFCLKDTEQGAYYVQKPDLSVTVATNTNPPVTMKVHQEIPHQYSWDVMALCTECNMIYRISGIPMMKTREIPPGAKDETVKLGLACCDICNMLYGRYRVGETFIRVTGFGHVYLCEEHAKEVEAKKGKDEDYKELIKLLKEWSKDGELPDALKINDQIVIVRELGGATKEVLNLLKKDKAQSGAIEKAIAKTSSKHSPEWCIFYLKGAGLVEEKQEGIMRKRVLSVTDQGRAVAEKL